MQPRRPQGHSSPPSTTTMWPISPAAQWAPARSSPPRTRAPPTPDPANTVSRSSKSRPAPSRCSARVAATTSLPTTTRLTPRASPTIDPSGTGSRKPGRLAAPNSSPVSGSTRPGEPIPIPVSLPGATLASLAAALITVAISATTASVPSWTGVLPLASPTRRPWRSTTTPWTLVPPRSIPAVCMTRMMPASSERWRTESAPWPTNPLARSRRLAGQPREPRRGAIPMSAATVPGDTTETLAARAVKVTKVYGQGQTEVRALDDVSVEFPSGRFTAIMGPSGSGKSTLMHCLAGLDRITSGQIFIGDVELSKLSEKQLTLLRRDKVGFVFQAFNLLPTLTAAENVELPLAIAGRKPDRAWVDRVIDAVGLRERLSHKPAELSGGQQQRVAAARALASKPAIVFADEPTGNLDSASGTELLGFMRRSVDEYGQTIVMVTHDPNAASFSDHVLFLTDGRIVDEMANPTAEKVLDLMKKLGG